MFWNKYKIPSIILGIFCSVLFFNIARANYVFNPFTKQLDRTVYGEDVVVGTVTSTVICLAGDICRTTWPVGGSADTSTIHSMFSATSPLVYSNGKYSIPAGTNLVNGYLSTSTYNLFNAKLSTETDPIFMAASTSLAYQPIGSYLTSETDPLFNAVSTSYLYTPGRAGGQTAYGGTTGSDNLIFHSNTDETGKMYFGNSINIDEEDLTFNFNIGRNATAMEPVVSSPVLAFYSSAWNTSTTEANIYNWYTSATSVDGDSTRGYLDFKVSTSGAPDSLMKLDNSGQLQLGIDPYSIGEEDPNVSFTSIRNVDGYHSINVANMSTGAYASTDIVAYNDLGGVGSFIDMGINGSLNADPNYAVFGPGSGYLYTLNSNLIVGSGGTASTTGNTYFFAGGTDDVNNIKMAMLYDGHVVIGGRTNSIASAKLEVQGDAYFKDSVGIGTAPDPINFNFSVRDAITSGISLSAGTGYNLMYFKRDVASVETAMAYMGLGSLTNNSFQVATYSGLSAPITLVPGSITAMYLGSETQKHIWTQYTAVDRFFGIGVDQATNLTSKLQVRDGRPDAAGLVAMSLDTGAWRVTSKLLQLKMNTAEKFFIDANGVPNNLESSPITTTDATSTTIATLPTVANKRYMAEIKVVAKQSGNTPGGYFHFMIPYARYTTGNAFVDGTIIFYASQSPTAWAAGGAPITAVVSGNDILIQATGAAATTITWKADTLINTNH